MKGKCENPTADRRRERETCAECGVTVGVLQRKRHLAGAVHLHSKRIRALLAEPCITLEEIGKRLGVTRERVRQIAKLLQLESNRHGICVLNRREAERERRSKSLDELPEILRARLSKFRLQGIEVLNDGRAYYHRLIVNGRRCSWRFASAHWQARKGNRLYFHFNVSQCADFLLLVAGDPLNTVYVIPASEISSSSICIPIGSPSPGWEKRRKHSRNWEQWREAWHLLTEKQSND